MEGVVIRGVPVEELLRAYDQKQARYAYNREHRRESDARHRETHREERRANSRELYHRKRELARQQPGFIERGRGRPKKVLEVEPQAEVEPQDEVIPQAE